MKKTVAFLTFLLAVLLSVSALAMTESEWNKLCTHKTSRSTTIYRVVSVAPLGPDDDPDTAYTFEAAGTIPAGTYLGSRQHGVAGKSEMGVWRGGQAVDYYIPSDAICQAVRTVTLPDGRKFTLPELAWGDAAAIREHLRYSCTAEDIQAVIRATQGGGTSTGTSTGTASTQPSRQRTTTSSWQAWLTREDGTAAPVTVVRLGSYTSQVLAEDTEAEVPTASLRFGEDELPPEQLIASVCTRTTGFVSLRDGAYTNATTVAKIPDGTLVGVIEPGEEFTRVSWKGHTGYVVTRGLAFHDAVRPPVGEGTLYQKGKATTSIFLRPEKNARWVAKWPQGETVTIVGEENGYYEVEKDGLRGWLKKSYVKLN